MYVKRLFREPKPDCFELFLENSLLNRYFHAKVEEKEDDVEPPPVELCDICDRPRDRQMRGFRRIDGKVTPVDGDSLCDACYCEVVDEIKDYIPHPGRSEPVLAPAVLMACPTCEAT